MDSAEDDETGLFILQGPSLASLEALRRMHLIP